MKQKKLIIDIINYIDSNIYTAQNEASTLTGFVKSGKNTKIDINFKFL